MGNFTAQSKASDSAAANATLTVRRPDGVVMPVKVVASNGVNAVIEAPNGEQVAVGAVIRKGEHSAVTVLVPLDKPHMASGYVVLGTGGLIISGAPTYLCQVSRDGEASIGYTKNRNGTDCHTVRGGKYVLEPTSRVASEGNYAWTQEPSRGVSFGMHGDDHVIACRPKNAAAVGHVTNDGCQYAKAGGVHISKQFDYLDIAK